MKESREIELSDVVFSEDDLIDVFYLKRSTKEEFDRKALLEVWHCFKQYLSECMKEESRIVVYRDFILQRDYGVLKLLENARWLEDKSKIAFMMEKYFKNGKTIKSNTPLKEEERNK